MPRYTVVMPAKDSAATIGLALKSVLWGLPEDAEILVWDDGSSDATSEVARSAADSRIRIERSEISIGGGKARQRILEITDSEFIINMDADDVSLPWRFRIQLAEMAQVDFCFTSSVRFQSGKLFRRPTLPISYSDLETRTSLAFHNGLTHPTMIARRSVLEQVGGYGASPVAQDYELWLRAAAQGARFRRLAVPCMAYRISPNQVSNQQGYVERILQRPEIFESYLCLLDSLSPISAARTVSNDIEYSSTLDDISLKLPSLLASFGKLLRPYYRRSLQKQPDGPFGLLRGRNKG